MAATASTPMPQSRNPQGIPGCFLDTDPPSLHTLPVNLRTFFSPVQKLALFRLRVVVSASRDPFFLDISPDKISTLSLQQGSPTYLHFRVTHITLIAPQEPLLRPITDADRELLQALCFFARQNAVRVLLPDGGYELSQLLALCEAIGRGGLRPEPRQTNLQSLYRGKGGRIVEADEELCPPACLFSTVAPSDGLLPAANPSSTARDDELAPPQYSNLASPPPLPPLSPVPLPKKRRRQTRTPSLSSDSSPDFRTWKHLDLVCGEREKMMYELIRRATKKEKTIRDLMDEMKAKEEAVNNKIADLSALIAEVEKKEAALREASGVQSLKDDQEQSTEPTASRVPTISVSPPASPGSTESISSNISDRVQTYIATQFDRLRDEIAREYATSESVEQQVSDEVDRILNRHVEEHQMFDAIREAIDEAMMDVRARILAAWE